MPPDIIPQPSTALTPPAAAGPAPVPASPSPAGGALGSQAVALLREGLQNITPEERAVLQRQINIQVQDIFGRAFGPEMFQFLAPFTAEERVGARPGAPVRSPAAPRNTGSNPLAAVGGEGVPV